MTVLLDQQAAIVIAHVVGDGFANFMFPLHHVILPYRISGALDKYEREKIVGANNDGDQFNFNMRVVYSI